MLKLVVFYNQYRQGFSETYYVDSGFTPQAFVDSIGNATLNNLVKFRDKATYLYALRASTISGARLSGLRVLSTGFGGEGVASITESQPDVVSTDAVLRLGSQSGRSRRVWLRGLPDDFVVRDLRGTDNPPAKLIAGFKSYMTALNALSAQIRYTVLPPDGGLTWGTVLGVAYNAGVRGMAELTVGGGALPAGIAAGQYAVFHGVPSNILPRFPRTAYINSVVAVAPFKVYVPYTVPSGGPFVPNRMRITALAYAYTPIYEYQFERFGEHKTGKPFGQLRGRSRAVARAF